MLPLRDYLTQRRQAIQSELKALRAELAEIDAAQRALAGDVGATTPSAHGKMTLKEMALQVLSANPKGLDALGILAAIKSEFGKTVQRESLSPQLSRLGQSGEVVREDGLWRIVTTGPGTPAESNDPLADVLGLDDSASPLKDLL